MYSGGGDVQRRMAAGRSNGMIAERLSVGEAVVAKRAGNIFARPELTAADGIFARPGLAVADGIFAKSELTAADGIFAKPELAVADGIFVDQS